MSYSEKIFNHTKEMLGKIAQIDNEISEWKNGNHVYSKEYANEQIKKLQEDREALISEGERTADALFTEYKNGVRSEFMNLQ